MNREEFLQLSAGHALRALSAEDERRFVTALVAHPEWAAEVDADRETAALLAGAAAPVAPAPELRGLLLDRIADRETAAQAAPAIPAAPDQDPAPAPRRTPARRGWFALAASLVVLLIAGGIGMFVATQQTAPTNPALAQIQRQPDAKSATEKVTGGGTATVHWSDSLGRAVLVSEGMPSLASDQAFELWYLRGGSAVPAGVFTASAGTTTTPLTGSMQAGDGVAVTVERSGGSPTGSPTSAPIVAIPTS